MDVLVVSRIKFDVREGVVAVFHLIRVRQMEAIGTHNEQIIGGFHRKEAHTIHLDADRTVEQTDCGTHGGFQLNHLFGVRVRGIHCLFVTNHRQRQHTIAFGELVFQSVDANPDRVGVEVRMLGDVLGRFLIVRMDLAHFTQD